MPQTGSFNEAVGSFRMGVRMSMSMMVTMRGRRRRRLRVAVAAAAAAPTWLVGVMIMVMMSVLVGHGVLRGMSLEPSVHLPIMGRSTGKMQAMQIGQAAEASASQPR